MKTYIMAVLAIVLTGTAMADSATNYPNQFFAAQVTCGTAFVKICFGYPASDNIDTNAFLIVPFIPKKIELKIADGSSESLYVTGTTNQYIAYGVTSKGITNMWVSPYYSAPAIDEKPILIERPLIILWVKGSGSATAFEIICEERE